MKPITNKHTTGTAQSYPDSSPTAPCPLPAESLPIANCPLPTVTDNGLPESLYWSDEGLLKAAKACTCPKYMQQLYNENATRIKACAALRVVFAGVANNWQPVLQKHRHVERRLCEVELFSSRPIENN